MEKIEVKNVESDGPLPIMYKNPFDKDVYWICDKDFDEKITSVFLGHGERYIGYMNTLEDVFYQENLLKNEGWVKCKKPEIEVTQEKLSRKMRRHMERKGIKITTEEPKTVKQPMTIQERLRSKLEQGGK